MEVVSGSEYSLIMTLIRQSLNMEVKMGKLQPGVRIPKDVCPHCLQQNIITRKYCVIHYWRYGPWLEGMRRIK